MTHSTRRLVRAIALATTVLSILVGGTITHSTPAQAATNHSVSRPFVENWVFRSTKLNRCVFVEVSGTLSGSWRYAYTDGSTDTLAWSSITIKNPTVTATGWPISGAGCDSTKRWKMTANIEQGWYQSKCDLDVSVSVGLPWSISATPTYSCPTKKVAHYASTEGPSSSTLKQFNSGSIKFANKLASVKGGGIAFKGTVSVRPHTSSASDLSRHTVTVILNK
jgi:predicted outer membrane repeat protein